ncbi:MAG: cation diffusion facilitator family transporter [Candidatus Caldatribacterium sp.]|uniref:cation diffusion facilitator family transporter n=1 Tax=Candidatus Caldatribacterium sp. TaxID=2282143 RepID=UPI00299A80AA|nr:cation diffusion facilitator family transporter [Candidatus Caldatribacterium sp.]MCX7730365.1 cation diffusion facilitator family transporter [Candidatus Caldatribacterium sp.]MDW8081824.1 cation diffusion facilitator family transporter [Candidatus Calescibacterium sp.]
MNEQTRYLTLRQTLLLVLVCNLGVALAKILYGKIVGVASITADGFHSLSDGTSNILGLLGLSFAFRPADESHPYGHKKFETLASLGIAMLLFVAALEVLREAWTRWSMSRAPEIRLESFLLMTATLMVNLFVVWWEKSIGRKWRSDFLLADALHTQSDVFVSLGVLGTLVAVRCGLPWVDILTALVIVGLIVRAGIAIIRESSRILCDEKVLHPEAVAHVVREIPEVQGCHKIRTRGRTDDIHLDLHVLVDEHMSVEEAHRVSKEVEQVIKEKFSGVTDVTVHIEPVTEKEENL